jgi:hypothetical protein
MHKAAARLRYKVFFSIIFFQKLQIMNEKKETSDRAYFFLQILFLCVDCYVTFDKKCFSSLKKAATF